MKKTCTIGAAALAAAATLGLGAGRAGAIVIEQHHYAETESFSLDCGFTLEGEAESSGHLLLRVDKGGQLFLAKDAYSFRTVLTNHETGKWFVLHGQGVYHDLRATPLGGGVYEVTAIETGEPFVIDDSSGRVVLRDRGAVRRTYVFDTLGDGQPGGDVLAVTDVVVHGPHPSLDEDFCEIATALTS